MGLFLGEREGLSRLVPRMLCFVLIAYLLEIVIGGPGQWKVGSLPPVRHLLFIALVAVYVLDIAVRGLRSVDLLTAIWMATLFIGWGLVIPWLRGTPIADAISDGRPLLAALVFPIVMRVTDGRADDMSKLFSVLFWASAGVVFLHVLFGLNLYINGHRIGQDVAERFFCFHVQCPGVYVGAMPGGGGRAHWIGSIFLLFFIAEIFFRRSISWTVLLGLALYFSWSRSLWIGSALILAGMVGILRRRFPWYLLVALLATILVTDVITSGAVHKWGNREGETAQLGFDRSLLVERNTQGGINVRLEQILSHLKVFASNPVAGTGFGSTAEIIRSTDKPWSSESTYSALLYKLGVLGMLVLLLPLILLLQRILHETSALTERRKKALLVMAGFLAMSAFNPYLMNAVGLTFLALLFAATWDRSEA